jgi:hypothetical protein
MMIAVQARDAAQIDHAASVTPKQAHGVSQAKDNIGPLIRLLALSCRTGGVSELLT